MKVKELIEILEALPQELEVVYLNGLNDGNFDDTFNLQWEEITAIHLSNENLEFSK